MSLSPENSYFEALAASVAVYLDLEMGPLRKLLKLNDVVRVRPCWNGISVLLRGDARALGLRLPRFVNKVLLERSHARSIMCCLWQLSHYNHRSEPLQQRLYGPKGQNYLLPYPLQRKSADPRS